MAKPAIDTVDYLVELGLTVYEAKAYLALLKYHPSKAHEVSKLSGIPAARVYEIISRLVEKGLAVPIGNDPILYEPLPAKEFVRMHRARLEHIVGKVEEQLENIASGPAAEVLWHITGYENLLAKAREIINLATRQVLLSLWTPQIIDLYSDLTAVHSKGISVVTIHFGENPSGCPQWPVGQVYRHQMSPTVHERHGSELLISVDGLYGLIMNRASGRDWEGFWTSNPAIVRVITNYIRHDIYLAKITGRYKDMLESVYGENMELLLDVEKDLVIGNTS
ncbi:MAG: helix-turn-helix domain-containing protein [Bacillota bacterium]